VVLVDADKVPLPMLPPRNVVSISKMVVVSVALVMTVALAVGDAVRFPPSRPAEVGAAVLVDGGEV